VEINIDQLYPKAVNKIFWPETGMSYFGTCVLLNKWWQKLYIFFQARTPSSAGKVKVTPNKTPVVVGKKRKHADSDSDDFGEFDVRLQLFNFRN